MDNTCPRTFERIPKWPQKGIGCYPPIRVHLLRDPERKRPPRALYIGRDSMARTIAFVDDIQVPRSSGLNFSSLMYSHLVAFSNRTHKYLNIFKTEYTLYDQSYQLLYSIARSALGTWDCTIYRLLNLFPGDNDPLMFNIRYINNFEMHPLNKVRTGWMEDPYSESVFYASANGGITSIHVLPMNRLLIALQDGIEGKRVFSYDSSSRTVISISGNLLFTQHTQGGFSNVYIRSFANLTQNSIGLSCGINSEEETASGDHPISITVVRDWDFCQLRDGPLADPLLCSSEREQWMVKEGMVTESGSLWPTVLIIVVITLVTLLFLLVLHIFWLRRNLDDTFEEVPEATSYRFPGFRSHYADMDLSVDRWNY